MPLETKDTGDALFSRTAQADAFGKLDAELQSIRIDSDTLVELHRAAHEADVSVSELVRDVLRARVWGVNHVETVNANRLKKVLGNAGTLRGAAS